MRVDEGGALLALKQRLAERWQDLCLDLFGAPTNKAKREWRWGRHGSLSIRLGKLGPTFYSFEVAEGGSLLDAIMFQRGCGFRDAVAWAREWLGGDAPQNLPRPRVSRPTFDADQDEAARIASANHLWLVGRSAIGTSAERYLASRGVTAFPAEAVRFVGARDIAREIRSWPGQFGAMVVPALDAAGTVRGVQLVALNDDGTIGRTDDGRKLKRSRGSLAGAAVRFAGKDSGPLFLAEGPETALSVWLASGCTTWALLGSIAKAPLDGVPLDRAIVVCRDDDRPDSPAYKARRNAVRAWRLAGRRVVEASPWPIARHDKTDFNDVLQTNGLDAVLAQLDKAVAPMLSVSKSRPSVEAARAALARQVGEATAELLAWRDDGSKPPFLVNAVDVGIGKSEVALGAVLDAFRAGRRAVYVAPTHKLNAELASRLRAKATRRRLSPLIEIYRGAGADIDPSRPGEKMCSRPDLYKKATDAHVSPLDTVCKDCPKREECAFLEQQGRVADIWLASTDVIFRKPARPIGKPEFLVIDEGFALRGLGGLDGPPQLVTLEMIEKLPEHGSGFPSSTADLRAEISSFRRSLANLLDCGGLVGRPIERSAVVAAGLTRDICQQAAAAEWKRFRDVPSRELDRDETIAWLAGASENHEVRLMVRLWEELANLVADDGPQKSGRIYSWSIDSGKAADSFRLVWCEKIARDWRVPTLHIDATADMALIRERVGSRGRLVGTAEAATPHMHVTQLAGRFGLLALMDKKGRHLDRVWSWILATARERGGRCLVVANKAVRDRLSDAQTVPSFVELAHFNALRGLDQFSSVRTIVVLGRPMPSPGDAEMRRGALTGRAAPTSLAGAYYPSQTTTLTGRDGSALSLDAEVHPDPLTEAIRRAVCEAELVQAIGRGRGVNRSVATPLAVYVLGNVPLPGVLPNTVGRWEPLAPDEEHYAQVGVHLQSVADMARLMGEPDRKRIEKARSRARLPTISNERLLYTNVGNLGSGARMGAYAVRQKGRDGSVLNGARISEDAGPLKDHLCRALLGATLTAIHDPWAPGMGLIRCQVTGQLNFGLAPTDASGKRYSRERTP